ncbi:MAG: class I SAM-dependent methyltransferase, partial [Brachybacterium sp.]|nr:class I SAM-dependent methyltransferase [Brachybacterium sp.]
LRDRIPEVTGIDTDRAVLEGAKRDHAGITWIHGDVMICDLDGPFDVVASVATLHHLPDLDSALARLAELTAPGGVLAVVGLARTTRPTEALVHLAGMVQHRWYARRHGYWEHTAPTAWPPRHSFTTVRTSAQRILTGAQWQLLSLWRYLVTWQKPQRQTLWPVPRTSRAAR